MSTCPECHLEVPDAAYTCPHCAAHLLPKDVAGAAAASVTPTRPIRIPTRVSVVDIDMPFGSMVVFMVKWALAAIPALIFLGIVGLIITTFLNAMMGRL